MRRNKSKYTKRYICRSNDDLNDKITGWPPADNPSDPIRQNNVSNYGNNNNNDFVFDFDFEEQHDFNIYDNNDDFSFDQDIDFFGYSDDNSSHDNPNDTDLIENTNSTDNSNDENDSFSQVVLTDQLIREDESSNTKSELKNGFYTNFSLHKKFPKEYVIELHNNHISPDLQIRKMERYERRNIGLYFQNFECKSKEILQYLTDNKNRLSSVFDDYKFKKD